MAITPLKIIVNALNEVMNLDGDNTVLVQHLTVVVNNLASAELITAHPELATPVAAPQEKPEGETVH